MTRKRPVYGSRLAGAFIGRADTSYPLAALLTFAETAGPALADGREVVARLTGAELAAVLGAVPAKFCENPADAEALARVRALLRRLDRDEAEETERPARMLEIGGVQDHDPAYALIRGVIDGRDLYIYRDGQHIATLITHQAGHDARLGITTGDRS